MSLSPPKGASAWRHCLVMQQRISHISGYQNTSEYISFFFPSLCLSVCLFPVGRLVWEEKDAEAEMRAEGTEKRHLPTCWQERERWSSKIKKFQKKKRTEKTRKENEAAPKYLHFLLPMFDVLSVCTCFVLFFSWSDWKGLGKNENIFVKRWLTTGRCVCYHISPRV